MRFIGRNHRQQRFVGDTSVERAHPANAGLRERAIVGEDTGIKPSRVALTGDAFADVAAAWVTSHESTWRAWAQ